MFTLNDLPPEFIVGIFPALLVGLLTRTHAPAWVKAVLNMLISAIAGSLALLTTSAGGLGLSKFVVAVAVTWVTSIAIHYGFWKPMGATNAVQNMPIGIGGSSDSTTG